MRDTRAMGFFWSAVSESEWPQDEQSQAEIRSHIQGEHGDRRTELVIIGRDMEPGASCLIPSRNGCQMNRMRMPHKET